MNNLKTFCLNVGRVLGILLLIFVYGGVALFGCLFLLRLLDALTRL